MRRFNLMALGILLGLGGIGFPEGARAQNAPADWLLDCGAPGANCSTEKYGLGDLFEYDKSEIPIDDNRWGIESFGGSRDGISYFVSRSAGGGDFFSCGGENDYLPIPGQVLLNEDLNCTPTATGPSCVGGASDGSPCNYPFNGRECGDGTCLPVGGCRVEIPLTDAGNSDPAVTSELWIGVLSPGFISGVGEWQISSATSNNFGGTSQDFACNTDSTRRDQPCDPNAADPENPVDGCPTIPGREQPAQCEACLPINVRPLPSMGTRYLLPDGHPEKIDGTETYVRWDNGLRAEDVVDECTAAGAPFACCTAAGTGTCGSADADAVAFARAASTNLRLHSDDTGVCAAEFNPPNNGAVQIVFRGVAQPLYPDLVDRTCRLPNRWITDGNVHPDWIFVAGPGSRFYTDPTHEISPTHQVGVCENNRSFACYAENDPVRGNFNASCLSPGFPAGCCTGLGTGNCTDPCNDDGAVCNLSGACVDAGQALDAAGNVVPAACCTGAGAGTCGAGDGLGQCPALSGLSCSADGDCDLDDVCDFGEDGIRNQVFCFHDNNGDYGTTCCATSLYRLRGNPGNDCSILPRRTVNGDPGPDCGVINYRVDHRFDGDCSGVADTDEGPNATGDLCPWLTEWNEFEDSGGVVGRGDACECGDHNGDGSVNINDILFTNAHIFGGPLFRLCDADNSGVIGVGQTPPTGCNINDILAQNASIFGRPATCRQVKPGLCGDGVVQPGLGEECDAGEVSDCTEAGVPHACCTGAGTGSGCNNDFAGPCNTICALVP